MRNHEVNIVETVIAYTLSNEGVDGSFDYELKVDNRLYRQTHLPEDLTLIPIIATIVLHDSKQQFIYDLKGGDKHFVCLINDIISRYYRRIAINKALEALETTEAALQSCVEKFGEEYD